MHERLARHDWPALLDWRNQAPHAHQAHPSTEHLMPLFIAMGAAGDDPQTAVLHRSHELGSLALDAFAFH
jgi:4,5-DOPA dioxygenase extradiol